MDVFKMMKQAAAMKQQMNKIQKELERRTAEGCSGDVTAVVRGDMTVQSIRIPPQAMDPSRPERLEKSVLAAVNHALEAVKKDAGAEMAKLTGGMGGLSELLGG